MKKQIPDFQRIVVLTYITMPNGKNEGTVRKRLSQSKTEMAHLAVSSFTAFTFGRDPLVCSSPWQIPLGSGTFNISRAPSQPRIYFISLSNDLSRPLVLSGPSFSFKDFPTTHCLSSVALLNHRERLQNPCTYTPLKPEPLVQSSKFSCPLGRDPDLLESHLQKLLFVVSF